MPPEIAACMYCRFRPMVEGGLRCAECAEYIDRLTDSDDDGERSYGWQLVNRAYRNRAVLGGLARNSPFIMAA